MLVHLRRAGALAFLAAGGALVSSACVANESSFFVRGCLQIPRDTCEVTATTTSPFISEGFLNSLYTGTYRCEALFENQLVQRGNATSLRTETSRIEVYAADVEVLTNDVGSPSLINKFTVPVSGFADPGNGTEPGVGSASITMIESSTLKKLGTGTVQVVAKVVLHGRTTGGQELTTNEFKFPVTVSSGSACYQPPTGCQGMNAGTPPADCILGQDESAADCRNLNPCMYLDCNPSTDPMAPPGSYSLASAHCPASGGTGDGTCCGAI